MTTPPRVTGEVNLTIPRLTRAVGLTLARMEGEVGLEIERIVGETGAAEPVVLTPPVNTAAPVASGTPTEGETLTCTTGTWTGTLPISYSYQWYRTSGPGSALIGGATSATYLLDAADVGEDVFCIVAAANVAGSDSFASNNVGPIASAGVAPVNTIAPLVTGTVRIGEVLSCTTGTWTGTPTPTYAYQWRRDGVDIGGATGATHTVVAADMAALLDCEVTATNVAGAASEPSNSLASPWQPILALKPGALVWDGKDPYCYGGAAYGAPVQYLRTVDGVLLAEQTLTGNQATRSVSNWLDFDDVDDHYIAPSGIAAYNNLDSTYCIHVSGLGGGTGQMLYYASAGAATRFGRVAISNSTSRNDHRTNASNTLIIGPVSATQDIVMRYAAAPDMALYDLAAGVSLHATATGSRSTGTFTQLLIGVDPGGTQSWGGNLRGFVLDDTAWDTTTMAVYRACAIAAGVM